MNSSSIRPPITRIRLPANRDVTAYKRAVSDLTGIGRGHLREGFLPAGRLHDGCSSLPRHSDQGQSGPRDQPVHMAPEPDGFIEDFQHRFIDIAGAIQPTVGPPGWRAGLVEAVSLLDIKTMRLQQHPRIAGCV